MVQAAKHKPEVCQPITTELLQKMKRVWYKQAPGWDERMLWAAVSLGFCGFLRSGEITVRSDSAFDETRHLTFEDVAVDQLTNPTTLRVGLKVSKTDPFRTGVDIFVGRTGCTLCPVMAMMDCLVTRGAGPGPLFIFQDRKPLTRERLVEWVRAALTSAGVDGAPFLGHNFCSGAATTAASRGINDATIKMLSRWKSEAYQLYIKPREQLVAVTKRLLRKDQPPRNKVKA